MINGTQVTFALNIPYLGRRIGAGTIQGAGQFPILGETYTVISDGSGDYAEGVAVEVKRSSMVGA
jgi:hypothetical protein